MPSENISLRTCSARVGVWETRGKGSITLHYYPLRLGLTDLYFQITPQRWHHCTHCNIIYIYTQQNIIVPSSRNTVFYIFFLSAGTANHNEPCLAAPTPPPPEPQPNHVSTCLRGKRSHSV